MAKKKVKRVTKSSGANFRISSSNKIISNTQKLSASQEISDLLSRKKFVSTMFFYLVFLAIFVYGFYYAVVFDITDGVYIILASIFLFILYKLIRFIISKVKK